MERVLGREDVGDGAVGDVAVDHPQLDLLAELGVQEQGTNTDPDQVDSTEIPELGACRLLTPNDVDQPANAPAARPGPARRVGQRTPNGGAYYRTLARQPITPAQVRDRRFPDRTRRGCDPGEVQAFLHLVADELDVEYLTRFRIAETHSASGPD